MVLSMFVFHLRMLPYILIVEFDGEQGSFAMKYDTHVHLSAP